MVLSEQEKGNLAWQFLIRHLRTRRVDELSVAQLRDKCQTILASALPKHVEIVGGSVYEFCNDLLDAVVATIDEEDVGDMDFRMDDDRRLAVAYVFCLYIVKEEGFRIGKNTKRELNARAKEFGIKAETMQAFFKTVARDLLDVAFN